MEAHSFGGMPAMFALRLIKSWTALTAIAVATSALAVDEAESTAKRLTVTECERLIEQLANPSKPPFAETYVHDLPKGVSTSGLYRAQKPIAVAYNELSANIETSLPVLVAHIADERFSYVYEDGISGVYLCGSIGRACARIIGQHVSVYREAVTKYDEEGRSKSLWFINDECGGIEKWWNDRQGRSLAELQLEGIEWAMRQPKPEYFRKREWAAAKKSLERMAEQIRASDEPIHVEHKVEFFSK